MKKIEICPVCGLEVAVDTADSVDALCPRCECVVVGKPSLERSACIRLVPANGPGAAVRGIEIGQGVFTLGRKSAKSSATLQIDVQDFFMSKRHTQIQVLMAGVVPEVRVCDAGSANGTFVNERKLGMAEEARLYPGDVLRMGNTGFIVEF